MNSKLVIFFFCVLFLSACGESGESIKAARDMSRSLSALYLPSGVGIYFGVSPEMDRVVDDKGHKLRIVTYHLESEITDVDLGFFNILQSGGYERIEAPKAPRAPRAPKGTNDLVAKYRDSSSVISFRYKGQVSYGLVKNTRLYVSWRI